MATSTEQTAYFDEIVDAADDVVEIKNQADSAATSAASQNASALASAKAVNEATYTAATENADLTYTIAVNNAWNTAYMAQLGLGGTLKDAFEIANTTLKNAVTVISGNFRAAAFAGWSEHEDIADQLAFIRLNSQASIDFGNGVSNDVFENPSLDFEVCFAAGTLVLMADGTKKPIEEIHPGDMVLATDHLKPEKTPEPARVVRTFDNGLKDVVRLRFSKNGVEEDVVCTPTHRFYIVGRGWVCASDIIVGEFGLSADGNRVEFLGRNYIDKKVCVYNLEIDGLHSYFVNEISCILVHNECEYIRNFHNAIDPDINNILNGLNYQVHHMRPQQFELLYKAEGIDINAADNLVAVPSSIHGDITNLQTAYFNQLIDEEINNLSDRDKFYIQNKSRKAKNQFIINKLLNNRADRKRFLDSVDSFNNIISDEYNRYMIRAKKGKWATLAAKIKVHRYWSELGNLYKKDMDFDQLKTLGKVQKKANSRLMEELNFKGLKKFVKCLGIIGVIVSANKAYSQEANVQLNDLTSKYEMILNEYNTLNTVSENSWGLLQESISRYLDSIDAPAWLRYELLFPFAGLETHMWSL